MATTLMLMQTPVEMDRYRSLSDEPLTQLFGKGS